MKFAGIGSRSTPPDILIQMTKIASAFESLGYTLRSGGAKGADQTFERGITSLKEIFYSKDATKESIDLALKYHPNPGALKRKGKYVLGLIGRNMQILLGRDLNDPVDFVVCWTPDGQASGGTGQAMRVAMDKNIPIYNLHNSKDIELLRELYQEKKDAL